MFCLRDGRIVELPSDDAPTSANTKSGVGIPADDTETEELPETMRPITVAVGELDSIGRYGVGANTVPGSGSAEALCVVTLGVVA